MFDITRVLVPRLEVVVNNREVDLQLYSVEAQLEVLPTINAITRVLLERQAGGQVSNRVGV